MFRMNNVRNAIRSIEMRCFASSAQKPNEDKMSKDLINPTANNPEDTPTKSTSRWRTPWHEKDGQYFTLLSSLNDGTSSASSLKFMQEPLPLSYNDWKEWWAKRKEQHAIYSQLYLPERNQMLGNELAAAHFLVHRGGAVKFCGDEKWIKANSMGVYDLPSRFKDDMYLQAIDCNAIDLYYEGMANLRGLQQLEWLSLNGCEKLDDWALDRVGYLFYDTLLYLDIRNMPGITYRGIGSLCKLEKLKILYVDSIFLALDEFEMTCLMLQEVNPSLDIRIEY